ncbi:MAG: Holliday junction resolvase [Dehalococcoidales bacterium]|nr:Holliday junction resolvase [Dehalococcoidales bacterium]
MHIAAIVALTVIAAVIIIFFFYQIIRLKFEKQFRDWQEEELVKWKSELVNSRREAVTQSRAVLGGKFTEQMVPYFPDFAYDPTEVRFIGTPIDLIVFPGLAQGDPQEIVILEIKTGKNPQLTPAQRKIRQLIEDGMVRWEEIYRSVEGD